MEFSVQQHFNGFVLLCHIASGRIFWTVSHFLLCLFFFSTWWLINGKPDGQAVSAFYRIKCLNYFPYREISYCQPNVTLRKYNKDYPNSPDIKDVCIIPNDITCVTSSRSQTPISVQNNVTNRFSLLDRSVVFSLKLKWGKALILVQYFFVYTWRILQTPQNVFTSCICCYVCWFVVK